MLKKDQQKLITINMKESKMEKGNLFGFAKGDKVEVIKEDLDRQGQKEYDFCSKGKQGILIGSSGNHFLLVGFKFKNPKNGKLTEKTVGCLYTDIKKV